MKKTLQFSIISAIIIGFTLPSSLFATAGNAKADSSAPSASNTSSQLAVVTAPVSAGLSVINASNKQPACNIGQTSLVNYVQDTGLINLNQTGDCFAINIAKLNVQTSLAVGAAQAYATIKVVNNNHVAIKEISNSNTVPQTSAALPMAYAVVLISVAAFAIEPAKKTLRRTSLIIRQSLTISQLQVMRC